MALDEPAVFFRVVLAWTWKARGSSILLAAILHASFHAASGTGVLPQIVPGGAASVLPLAAVVLLAVVVVIARCLAHRLRGDRLREHSRSERAVVGS